MTRGVVLFGCPRTEGGANTEAGHTALLWRSMGIPVTVLPTAQEPPENPWPKMLADAGCVVKPEIKPDNLVRQPWLFRSIIVDFACERAVRQWNKLARMGCRLIHCPTHCFTQPWEHDAFRHRPPTVVVFESRFQRDCLSLQYSSYGVPESRMVVIHGAFNQDAFPFAPRAHGPREPFAVGRLARPVEAKWPRRLVDILIKAGEHSPVPIEGDLMGWTPSMEKFSGKLPAWIYARGPCSLPVPEYLSGLHAMLAVGDCYENWSRVVLEAFAVGVPVIADRRGGLREQIVHGETGFLCDTVEEAAEAIVRLACDEKLRLRIARQARGSLATLANPQTIGHAWGKVFCELSGKCS
jgi:glycosyltransferase involved in cell wall biosynthesis